MKRQIDFTVLKIINIHIGIEKTGTTAIQNFLKENRKILEDEYQICIPKWQKNDSKNTHHQIAKAFIPNQNIAPWHSSIKIKDFKTILNRFLVSKKFKELIISSELFCYSTEKEIKYLRQLLLNCNVKIIIFLRRQDEYLESLYNQHLKRIWSLGRKPIPIEEFKFKRQLNFYDFVSKWYINGFTNIDLKIYNSLNNKDFIFFQFFKTINQKVVLDRRIVIKKNISNPSLSLLHNTLITDFVPSIKNDELRKQVSNLIFKHNNLSYIKYGSKFPSVKNHFSNDYKLKLLTEFQLSNSKLLKQFPESGYNKKSLFRPMLRENIKTSKINDLTHNEVLDILFDLLLFSIKK